MYGVEIRVVMASPVLQRSKVPFAQDWFVPFIFVAVGVFVNHLQSVVEGQYINL